MIASKNEESRIREIWPRIFGALVHFLQVLVKCRSLPWSWPPMPHKHNADRRHHIPKMAFKVENWPEYEAGLRRRGSLTLWIEDGVLDHWQTFGPGGQARYTDAAIQTTLMVRTAFRLPLRQTEGLMASVITLMDLTISAPDHSTISRRAVTLPVGVDPTVVSPAAISRSVEGDPGPHVEFEAAVWVDVPPKERR